MPSRPLEREGYRKTQIEPKTHTEKMGHTKPLKNKMK